MTQTLDSTSPVSGAPNGQEADDLTSVIELATEELEDGSVSVGDLVDSVSHDTLVPLLLLPAVALATPLSGIPLFSSVMGIIISVVSFQMLMQREKAWLPLRVLNLHAKAAHIRSAFRKIKPAARWLDRQSQPRLTFLAQRPFVLVPQALCLISGLTLPFLEFVPFSSSLMGVAIALMGFGMLRRDGLILLIAILPYLGIGWLISRVVA